MLKQNRFSVSHSYFNSAFMAFKTLKCKANTVIQPELIPTVCQSSARTDPPGPARLTTLVQVLNKHELPHVFWVYKNNLPNQIHFFTETTNNTAKY